MFDIVDIQNFKMALIPGDEGISLELKTHGVHEKMASFVYRKIVKDNMIILDIGANLGYYAFMAAQLNPNGRVYAIEPVYQNYLALQEGIKANNFTNIRTTIGAIGDYTGVGVIKTALFSNSATMVDMEKASDQYRNWFSEWETGKEGTLVYTLDRFMCDNMIPFPDIMRMDVEGYEYNIFKEAKLTLKGMPIGSWIFIELHSNTFTGNEEKEILDMLAENGFQVMYGVDAFNNTLFIKPYKAYVPTFKQLHKAPQLFFQKVCE